MLFAEPGESYRDRIDRAVAMRLEMSRTIVLQDNNMIASILDFLPRKGCLGFVLTCKLFRECHAGYLKRELVSDSNYYCGSASQIEWLKSLPGRHFSSLYQQN